MDKQLMEELESYRATAALKLSGVNMVEIIEDRTKDVIHLTEENKRYKERNKKLSTKLSTATTERDKLKKEVKGYESILFNLKFYLDGEKDIGDYTNVPHLLDYLKELERVAKK